MIEGRHRSALEVSNLDKIDPVLGFEQLSTSNYPAESYHLGAPFFDLIYDDGERSAAMLQHLVPPRVMGDDETSRIYSSVHVYMDSLRKIEDPSFRCFPEDITIEKQIGVFISWHTT